MEAMSLGEVVRVVALGLIEGLGMITLVDMNGKWGAGLATVTKGLMAGLLVGHPVGIKAVHLNGTQVVVDMVMLPTQGVHKGKA